MIYLKAVNPTEEEEKSAGTHCHGCVCVWECVSAYRHVFCGFSVYVHFLQLHNYCVCVCVCRAQCLFVPAVKASSCLSSTDLFPSFSLLLFLLSSLLPHQPHHLPKHTSTPWRLLSLNYQTHKLAISLSPFVSMNAIDRSRS